MTEAPASAAPAFSVVADVAIVKGETPAGDRTWLSFPDGTARRAVVHVVHDLPHLVVESVFRLDDGLWGTLAAGGFAPAARAVTRRPVTRGKAHIRLVTDAPFDELAETNWPAHKVAKAAVNAVLNRWGDGPDTPDGVRARLRGHGPAAAALAARVSDEQIRVAAAGVRRLYADWARLPAGGTLRVTWPLHDSWLCLLSRDLLLRQACYEATVPVPGERHPTAVSPWPFVHPHVYRIQDPSGRWQLPLLTQRWHHCDEHGWHSAGRGPAVRSRPLCPREPALSTGARAGELRVMIVTDQYEPMIGGVPTVTRELARGLAERGHAVTLVAPSASGHGRTATRAGAPETEAGPLTVAFRGSVRWPWYEGQRLGFLAPAAARRLIGDFAPDVVHLHSPLTLGATARSAARRRGVPVLYTNHYLPANVWPGTAARSGTERLGAARSTALEVAFYTFITGFANRCDHVTAPTATALRLLRDHGLRAPSQVVSNGIDLDAFAPEPSEEADTALRTRYALPPGRPLILSVGRLSPEKRADVLIEAAARLTEPGALLVLAGTGPDEDRLRALAASSGARDRVRFLGFVPGTDLPALYRSADVFAIASQAELQSLVTMEAMASGLPVVAVEAGALGELVHGGENGFLAKPGRAADIAVSLDLLCRDATLRTRMSRASRRIIADHDRYRLLSRWESIYRVLAARDPAPEDPAPEDPAPEDPAPEEKNRQR